MTEELKTQFQKEPQRIQGIIEDLVASGDPVNKMVASDWLYHLWRSGCIKNLDGHVINSYAVWALGDKVYHCGHCIGRTGGFMMTKVQTRDQYEESKNQPNRGGDGWWDHQMGSSPVSNCVAFLRKPITLPAAPNRYDRVIESGGYTIFDFMAPFSEKLLERSQARRDAHQRAATGGQSPLLPPSELRVSAPCSRRPKVARTS